MEKNMINGHNESTTKSLVFLVMLVLIVPFTIISVVRSNKHVESLVEKGLSPIEARCAIKECLYIIKVDKPVNSLQSITLVKIPYRELSRHPFYTDMDIVRKIKLMQITSSANKTSLVFEDELKVVFKFIDPMEFFKQLFFRVYKTDAISVVKYEFVNYSLQLFIMMDFKDNTEMNKYKLKEPKRYQYISKIFLTGKLQFKDTPIPLFKDYYEG